MEKRQAVIPTIAGILMIVSAGLKLLAFSAMLAASFFYAMPGLRPNISLLAGSLLLLPSLAIIALAVAGGIFSLHRRRWNLALTGAIVSILPFSLLGIAATVLLVISKDEFERV